MPCIRLKLYSLCVELIVILIVIVKQVILIEKRTGCVEKEFRSKFVLQVWTISRELIETVQLNVHFFYQSCTYVQNSLFIGLFILLFWYG